MTRTLRTLRFLLLAVGAAAGPAAAAPPLPALGADLARVTVSGVSSGGYMAVQLQVAHSTLVKGAGVIAAGPYACAEGSLWRALRHCADPGFGAQPPDTARTLARLDAHAGAGRIDARDGLADDRAWVLAGGADGTVAPAVVAALARFYEALLAPGAVHFAELPGAGHAMISIADPEAKACASSEPPFINRCGDFDAAGELLAHLYGPLVARTERPGGELAAFDQRPFAERAPLDLSLADEGYVYVPAVCRGGGCAVHVALHGCRQSAAQIGRRFVEGAGYNEWADTNRLIVLYPQTVPRSGFAWGSWRWVYNPKGCWDWWGYTGPAYATRDGEQIRALRAMLARLAEPPPPAAGR